MKCSSFRKSLSPFLDDELEPRKREQMERHILECASCRRETEKLREMIQLIGSTPRHEVPSQAWAGTLRKIETAEAEPAVGWFSRFPKWGTIPAAAAIFALLLYVLGTQNLFTGNDEVRPMSINVYLQEHELSYSQQVLSPDFLNELTNVQTTEVAEETGTDESMSELDMLVEVHYGIYEANGS